jgi:hypothetical protein
MFVQDFSLSRASHGESDDSLDIGANKIALSYSPSSSSILNEKGVGHKTPGSMRGAITFGVNGSSDKNREHGQIAADP